MPHRAQVLDQVVNARVRALLGVTLIAAEFMAGWSVGSAHHGVQKSTGTGTSACNTSNMVICMLAAGNGWRE